MFFQTIFSIFFDEEDRENTAFSPEDLTAHYRSEISSLSVDRIYIAWAYRDYHKKIESYKYRSNREYAEYFAQIFDTMIQKYIWDTSEYIIVPVPMHWSRYLYRSYDHMGLIASILEKEYGYYISHLLGVHFSLKQAKLHKQARKKNSVDRFFLKNRNFWGKKIILIDDIISSGYTLSSCSKLLKNISHSEIISFFIASNSY